MKFKKIMLSILFIILCITCDNSNKKKIDQINLSENNMIKDDVKESNNIEKSKDEIDFLEKFSQEKLDLYFKDFNKATFLISDGKKDVIYNKDLANTPISPYSTFKIPNSIIALETKAIINGNTMKKWDGVVNSREVANHDHDLDSAFENSIVWYYKELAKDIGRENMKEYLEKMDYGNKDISGGIDKFWLGSSLKITPLEQLEFLKKLYYNSFGFSEETMAIMKSIMKQKNVKMDIYGKTGSSGKGMYWFIGYIMIEDKPYFFVTYLEDDKTTLTAKEYTVNIFDKLLND